MRRPSISRVLTGITLVGTLFITGCGTDESAPDTPAASSASSAGTTPEAPKGIPEDPNATVHSADLEELGGLCALTDTQPINGQGTESTYKCGGNLIRVQDIRGDEAKTHWNHAKKSGKAAPEIAKNVRISSGQSVVVFVDAGEDSRVVDVDALKALVPFEDTALIELGKSIAQEIQA